MSKISKVNNTTVVVTEKITTNLTVFDCQSSFLGELVEGETLFTSRFAPGVAS